MKLSSLLQEMVGYVEEPKTKWLSVERAESIFKFFHLSANFLDREVFTFTPRIPDTPFEDDHGAIIEDDFTKRISLAPTIKDALNAIAHNPPLYVYAVDFKETSSDDVDVIDVSQFDGPSYKTPEGKEQRYNINFTLGDYIEDRGGKETVVVNPSHHAIGNYWGNSFGPKKLKKPYKDEFRYAVPDARSTHEAWSLQPITMVYLGRLFGRDAEIMLSQYADELLTSKGLLEEQMFGVSNLLNEELLAYSFNQRNLLDQLAQSGIQPKYGMTVANHITFLIPFDETKP